MKLYSAIGPSARTVRMFIAEKFPGIDLQNLKQQNLEQRNFEPQNLGPHNLELQDVDLLGQENLTDEFRKLNPAVQLPFMVLDDGFVLGESLAICEYLDELYSQPSLLGSSAKERAETRMWCRRIDLRILEPMIQGFKASDAYEFFKDRYTLVVKGADELKALGHSNLVWLNRMIADKPYICGDRFSLADIQLFCFLAHSGGINNVAPNLDALDRWYQRVNDRDSVAISVHPGEPN